MPIVDSDFLSGARTTFQALFDKNIGAEHVQWSKVATPIPADKSIYSANWLGAPPQLREFFGEIEIGKVFPHNYTLNLIEYGVAIEVKEMTFRQDGLGTVSVTIGNMTFQASRFYDKLVFEKMSDGFDTVCYDGQFFYDSDHSVGDAGTHNNVATATLAAASYQTGWQTINTAKDDAGEVMGWIPDLLAVHPNSRKLAKDLLAAQFTGGGNTNTLNGDAEILTAGQFKTTTEWHLMATAAPAKPMLLIEALPLRFVALDDMTSDHFFRAKAFLYKVEAEAVPGYGLFQQAYGSDGTV